LKKRRLQSIIIVTFLKGSSAMNSRQLQSAILLSQIRNFSQVAEYLNITQPALSKQISTLEGELGVRLFDRSTTPLTLTPAGESFVRDARELLYRQDQLLRSMEEFRSGNHGRLVIGISPFRCLYLIPEVIAALQQKFPGLRVILKETGSAQLHKGAAEGEFDLAIVNLPADEAMLDIHPLAPERIVLAVPQALASAIPTEAAPSGELYPQADLANCPDIPFVVLGQGQELRQLFDKLCVTAGLRPKIAVEAVGITTAWALVRSGIGAAILPAQFAEHQLFREGTVLFSLKHDSPVRQPVVVTRKGQYLSEYAKYALKLLTE